MEHINSMKIPYIAKMYCCYLESKEFSNVDLYIIQEFGRCTLRDILDTYRVYSELEMLPLME